MKRKVIAVYEDSPGEQVVNFGPHALALATVADRLGLHGRWALKAIEGNPKKGATNAMRAAALLADSTHAIVLLLLDEDQIRDQLNLAGNSTDDDVWAALRKQCPGVELALLRWNTEDLVRQAAAALGVAAPEGKDRQERDRLLNSLANGHPQARLAVLDEILSWKQWVDLLETAARRAGYP